MHLKIFMEFTNLGREGTQCNRLDEILETAFELEEKCIDNNNILHRTDMFDTLEHEARVLPEQVVNDIAILEIQKGLIEEINKEIVAGQLRSAMKEKHKQHVNNNNNIRPILRQNYSDTYIQYLYQHHSKITNNKNNSIFSNIDRSLPSVQEEDTHHIHRVSSKEDARKAFTGT